MWLSLHTRIAKAMQIAGQAADAAAGAAAGATARGGCGNGPCQFRHPDP